MKTGRYNKGIIYSRMPAAGIRPVYGNPTLRAMHSIHKCVAKDAPHLLAVLCNEPRIGKIKTVIGSLLTNHGFYFCRDAANACRRPSGIYNSLVIPSGFHNLGINNKTSFSYPQTFFLSVGISNKTSFSYPQTFLSVGISSKTSFPYPQTFHSVGISNQTSFSYPQAFHSVGISNQTSFSYP